MKPAGREVAHGYSVTTHLCAKGPPPFLGIVIWAELSRVMSNQIEPLLLYEQGGPDQMDSCTYDTPATHLMILHKVPGIFERWWMEICGIESMNQSYRADCTFGSLVKVRSCNHQPKKLP